ncbi:hypothetical protein JCM8208_005670 [Rhodotorula glutinis]
MLTSGPIGLVQIPGPGRLPRAALEQLARGRAMGLFKPPPNLLLPSPRVPWELLNEVFAYLEAIEDDSERIEVGKQVSLVCRNWRIVGHRIVFAKVTLYCDGLERAVKLLQHPRHIESIRELSVKRTTASEEVAPVMSAATILAALGVVVQVIEGCSSRLKAMLMDVDIADGAVLDRIARSSPASTLRTLRLIVRVGPGCSLFDIVSALSRFVGLSILNLYVERDGRSDLSAILSMRTASLRLKALTLIDDQTEDTAVLGDGLSRALAPLWDPSSLRKVALFVTAANAQDLAWLSRLPQLKEVTLGTPSFDYFPAVCVPMIDVVKTLLQVNLVQIEPDMSLPDIDDCDLEDSPIELDYVLDSIPPNVKDYFVEGVVFDDVFGLRLIAPQNARPGSPRVVVHVKSGLVGNVPSRVALVRKLRANGVQTWAVLGKLVPADDDDEANSLAADSPPQSTAYGADDERDDSHDTDTSI